MTVQPLPALQLAFAGLSPVSVDRLISVHGSVEGAVRAVLAGRTKLSDVAKAAVGVAPQHRQQALDLAGIRFLVSSRVGFPHKLEPLPGAPRWLFAAGDAALVDSRLAPAIAIVGSRSATAYGLELAERYGYVAASSGWHVVSGLARGIDAAAHRGALDGGAVGAGRCIGVLGSGIDVVYPKSNRDLYRRVVDSGGALISEYPPATRPDGWRFPTRNRIIAGLADVVLVVEASQKGGALITARIALDYGVPVYAVPGDIDRETSMGTNDLIRDGSFPVFGAEDLAMLLELLEPLMGRHRASVEETRVLDPALGG